MLLKDVSRVERRSLRAERPLESVLCSVGAGERHDDGGAAWQTVSPDDGIAPALIDTSAVATRARDWRLGTH